MKLFLHEIILYIQLKLYKTVNPMSRLYVFIALKKHLRYFRLKKKREIKKK